MNTSSPLYQVNFTTTPIQIFLGAEKLGNASGFFFKENERRFLVTNRHVFIDESEDHFPDQISIDLHLSNRHLSEFEQVILPLYNSGQPLWIEHPKYSENGVDIALLELNLDRSKYFSYSFSKINFLQDREFDTIPDVLLIGYPLGFYDDIYSLPVYRKGTVASPFGHRFMDFPYFLIDSNLHEGTSGGPVLSSPHNTIKQGKDSYVTSSMILLGVHSAEHYQDGDPLGLNVVWYADLILEIINFN